MAKKMVGEYQRPLEECEDQEFELAVLGAKKPKAKGAVPIPRILPSQRGGAREAVCQRPMDGAAVTCQ